MTPSKKKQKCEIFQLGSWNVRTMCPGMNEHILMTENIRNSALIDRELDKRHIDIAALQETRLAGTGSIREVNYTFYWHGKSSEDRREYGVGFAVSNRLIQKIESPVVTSERIISLRLSSKGGFVNIINVYAPTLYANEQDKDTFYDCLNEILARVPHGEKLFIVGDLNARVGSDRVSWPMCLGYHGVGRINENGPRLLELCAQRELCITNTYFQGKHRHKVSWRHLRSGHWHQLDLIITRRRDLPSVLHTRTYHSADCDTDHSLVISKTASDKGDLRMMYEGIKKAIGPTIIKTAPLKSLNGEVLTDKNKQMSRWVEHYLELYSTETDISQVALDTLPQLPVMGELDHEPSVLELSQAIDSLANGKAPGKDGIPAEILKCRKVRILPHLYDLLLLCWRTETIPHDMRDANIITLYKNKGDRGDCNNYRGISLLSVTEKTIAKVILKRLAHLADRIYPEAQCGFRPSRSTVDMIFSLRQLQEKCREQQMPLFIAFVDLTKAFDTISRAGLYKILEKIGCPPKLLNLIHSFHKHMHGTVQFDDSTSNSFELKSACS
ncbi:uncharacterized protein LOC117112703 [Anneissia japonica]|uniref:uncharacterized protein LOC117112703 n=1 Tax=Anneissia japonica TaxID=1529436 RepID=UPI0014259D66|nr:uncharacterized protein LOC117112703 [Anneissia japonica]